MAGEWREIALWDIAEYINGRATKPSELASNGVPVIKIAELNRGITEETDRIPPELVQEKHWVSHGDLLFAWSGSVGIYRYTGSKAALNQHIFRVVGKPGIDQGFLRYLLLSCMPVFHLHVQDKRTTMGHVTKQDLQRIKVRVPPLQEQRAIAHILGTLDDKIELNRRMSETLEGMARALFKAWFVDFEPVRAKLEGRWQRGQSLPGLPAELYDLFPDRLVDSELGQIPEGWEVGTINDICSSIENGGTPRRMETQYWNGSIPWFKTGELTDGPLLDSEEKITEIGLAKSSCKLWPTKTILVALYASPTVGRLGILETSATANQACSGLIAKANYGYLYLFYSLLFSRDRLQKIAVGAAQQNISQQVLRQHKIIIASSVIAQFFHRHVEAAYQYQVLLIAESRALAGLCDALLPKLIRGEMRVRDAERFLEQRGL